MHYFRMSLVVASLVVVWAAAPLVRADEVALPENDCAMPTEPELPDGASASQADMVEAQKGVKAFIAAGEEYIACLTALEAGTEDAEQKLAVVAAHNQMVDSMEQVAARFNEQIRAFRAQ